MLDRSKKYVNNAKIELLVNYDEFRPSNYGNDTIKRRSKLMRRQFNSDKPSYAEIPISIDELEDETSFINFGQYQ